MTSRNDLDNNNLSIDFDSEIFRKLVFTSNIIVTEVV